MYTSAESKFPIIYQLTIIFWLNIILVQCAPMLQRTNDGSWDENMVDCSPGGRCWESLHRDELPVKEEDYYKNPLRIKNQNNQDEFVVKSSPISLPSVNRPMIKKDVFMSRGWGAGGMPFSVLYMNPHSPRPNSNTGGNEVGPVRALPLESPVLTSPSRHSNNRVALRNGASGQPRRQYSIIPQLFVSYGWGPLGK